MKLNDKRLYPLFLFLMIAAVVGAAIIHYSAKATVVSDPDITGQGGGGSGSVTSVDMTVPPFLAVAGNPITTSGTLAVTLSGTALPVASGGTGQTTTTNAINALVPTQTGNAGEFLTTDGSVVSWAAGGSGANTALSNLGVTSINAHLLFGTADTFDVGSSSSAAQNVYTNGVVSNNALAFTASNGEFNFTSANDAIHFYASTVAPSVFFWNDATSFAAALKAPAALAADYTLTLPPDDGTSGQFLTTNGAGILTWTTGGGGGANTTLSNLGVTNINASLFFNADAAYDIGSASNNVNQVHARALISSTDVSMQNTSTSGAISIGSIINLATDGSVDIISTGGVGVIPLKLYDDDGAEFVGIKTIDEVPASYTLVLPSNDGDAGQFLRTSGSGILSWVDAYDYDITITAGGTTGAQTIDKPAGRVNFAAAATSLVVTDSLVNTSTLVFVTGATNDTTCKSFSAVPAAGSFTIHANAACTAETAVAFTIIK